MEGREVDRGGHVVEEDDDVDDIERGVRFAKRESSDEAEAMTSSKDDEIEGVA